MDPNPQAQDYVFPLPNFFFSLFFSLKRVKREQTEEEAGSHRGLCATEPPKEGSGSFFALAVRAIFAPVVLGLGLGMERSSLLLGRAPSVTEAGVARLYGLFSKSRRTKKNLSGQSVALFPHASGMGSG
jgi:hypothetical protein